MIRVRVRVLLTVYCEGDKLKLGESPRVIWQCGPGECGLSVSLNMVVVNRLEFRPSGGVVWSWGLGLGLGIHVMRHRVPLA